jgi:hypothetical protein
VVEASLSVFYFLFFGPIGVHALSLFLYIFVSFFKSCLVVPKLRLKTQSKKAEREKVENQYFPYSTLITRAMVEAYCPTLVKLVFNFI